MSQDTITAKAFADSWNNLPEGSVYSANQFIDWFEPLTKLDIEGKSVLELGCGNGSLLTHMTNWNPSKLHGVDLGDSVKSCKTNMEQMNFSNYEVIQGDLTTFEGSDLYDITYCIGVLHHLKEPYNGFQSVLNNTKSGGKFHCWVYAYEGNAVIRYIVDPIRKIASLLPWWANKFLIATPLSFIYFIYAHIIIGLHLKFAPLYEYSKWICQRGYLFFRHVAFDQLVTPQTVYIKKSTIEEWLSDKEKIVQGSTYIIFRNGNSWKFGGIKK
ncbi:MAG: methyltransferase domain-containing protein [Chitinophagales bacterium]|nr:methyltransferase domain-containing protein [Chitinophagales bacterium]